MVPQMWPPTGLPMSSVTTAGLSSGKVTLEDANALRPTRTAENESIGATRHTPMTAVSTVKCRISTIWATTALSNDICVRMRPQTSSSVEDTLAVTRARGITGHCGSGITRSMTASCLKSGLSLLSASAKCLRQASHAALPPNIDLTEEGHINGGAERGGAGRWQWWCCTG